MPEGVWAAPGRVNLIGEHTDYNDGFVLPIAIDRHAVVALGTRPDDRIRLWSLEEADPVDVSFDEVGPGTIHGWGAYAAGVAWALRRASGSPGSGFEGVVTSSVPIGAGLSSSAALGSAFASGLAELWDAHLDPIALARVAQRAEVEVAGVPCGLMDQMASILCRSGHALFVDMRTLSIDHIPADLTATGVELLIIRTMAPRRLVEGRYADRRAECDSAALALGVDALRDVSLDRLERAAGRLDARRYRRARHVVTENARVLAFVQDLRGGRADGLGSLLTASHRSLRDDFEVSTPELDTAVEAALSTGALGARMIGAGFGGSVLALAPRTIAGRIAAAATTSLPEHGFAAPDVFTVTPAGGSRRVG
jgi:galactokinase